MDFGGDDVFFSFFFSFFAFVFSKGQIALRIIHRRNNHPSFPHDGDEQKKKEERRRQDLNLRTRCVFDF